MTPSQIAVNDVGNAEDFLAAIEGTIKNFNDGDLVSGIVVQIDREEVLLDIGYKTEGVIPSRELSIRHDVDPSELVKVGDRVEALVLQKEDKEGRLILSKKRAQYEQAWGDVEGKKERDEVVTGTVIEVVKGGLIVDIGLRGFLPASLVEMRRVRDLTPYIGQQVECRIIELDTVEVLEVDFERERVSLSLKATQEDPWQAFARTNSINQVVNGEVTKLVPFGAFIKVFEGIEGLVHISELAERHVEIPEQVVQVGDKLFVKIIDIDLERRRISLSLKQANEGQEVEVEAFDPAQYGMPARYDSAGNFIYPEGFDADTQEWKPGYESQREEWERQYAEAQARFMAHKKQKAEAKAADAAAPAAE